MKDDFWDIDKLLPRKPATTPSNSSAQSHSNMLDATVISDGVQADKSVSLSDILKTSFKPEKQTQTDYSSKSSVIISVITADINNTYSYTNDFYNQAHKMHYANTSQKADFVSFFSYMPQYSDLSDAQYKYYLWWRECVRNGEFLPTDASYIFLYIYEIIALDDVIKPENAVKIIISLWAAYYEKHPVLNKYLGNWITDYALIHNITIPFDMLEDVLPYATAKQQSILYNMYLFDYIFKDKLHLTDNNIMLVCRSLSNYDPYKSKSYADGDYKRIFDGCIKEIFKKLYDMDFFSSEGAYLRKSELKLTRPSYLSAVCSVQTKKNITVTYYPCISNELIRTAFSNIIKHTENKIRAALGMRSRLPNIVLADEIRQVIDGYMNKNLPAVSKHKATVTQNPAPIREIKKIEVDFRRAKEIEDFSWQTTEKLTQGLDIDSDAEVILSPISPAPFEAETDYDNTENGFALSLTPNERLILRMILNGAEEYELEKAMSDSDELTDAVIDRINEKALEHMGDTVIDPTDRTIIPDYKDELLLFNI